MATSMIHVFPSGMPQPSDMMIALAIVYAFGAFCLGNAMKVSLFTLLCLSFGAYAFVVNLIHFLFMPDLLFFKSSFYYIFNVSVLIFIVHLFKSNPRYTRQAVYWAVLFSIVFEFLHIEFMPSLRGFRETGTFSNPNQLAVWSLTVTCILVVICARQGLRIRDYICLGLLGFMQIVALSKAGMICYMLVILSLPFSASASRKAKTVMLLALATLCITMLSSLNWLDRIRDENRSIDKAVSRIEQIGTEDDESFAGRNYTRIMNNPQFILLGAGEGAYYRFEDSNKNLEIHSGIGTLVFSYGIIGTALFFAILYHILRRTDLYIGFLIAVLLLYGLTHQNIRSTHFWVFLGMAYGMRYTSREATPLAQPAFPLPEHSRNPRTDYPSRSPAR